MRLSRQKKLLLLPVQTVTVSWGSLSPNVLLKAHMKSYVYMPVIMRTSYIVMTTISFCVKWNPSK